MTKTSTEQRIPAYEGMSAKAESAFAQYNGAQLGDPVKGVEIIYDVITSTGVAERKELPGFCHWGVMLLPRFLRMRKRRLLLWMNGEVLVL